MYKNVDPHPNFPALEKRLLDQWDEEQLFQQTLDNRHGSPAYIFYDGPPFATGMPHYGHILVGNIKDVILRYQTMRGRYTPRRFGWDCHGLPVEYEMEKELGISGKRQIEDYGVARFNEACRSIVQRYSSEWRAIVRRSGRWVDFENEYKTMDPDYMESIWWIVKELWRKNLLYSGYNVLPYCPRCSTALSNHELNLGGYREVDDPAITVRFRVTQLRQSRPLWLLAWTTTPWTLVANQALAVGSEFCYVQVRDGDDDYLLAEDLLGQYFPQQPVEIVRRFRGEELVGWSYQPILPYFAYLQESGCFRVFSSSHVTTGDGTGIVHIAPGFGEDDYQLLARHGLPTALPIDEECRYTEEIPEYRGLFVKEADKAIIRRLKEEGSLLRHEQIKHAYPHCWRCNSPLIYRAISSWFVRVTAIKDKMVAANQQIQWSPAHLQQGRFGKWLANARDWAISRNRYWGNPIPIWECENGHHTCVGSRAELARLSGVEVDDLHKHFVDPIRFPCPECQAPMARIPEVLDCWFESGAMPYAQHHYPFRERDYFESHFPADFINESLDQTRGWFYTLVVLAAALFDTHPFRRAIVSGMILAQDGKKMSKSARNYTDPVALMDKYGADAMRLYLFSSPVLKAEPIRFNDEHVRGVLRTVLLPLWNAYSFFVHHANLEKLSISSGPEHLNNPLDRWLLSELEQLRGQVESFLDQGDLQPASQQVLGFVNLLNNWYIRRSRRRFQSGHQHADKQEAFATLWLVLVEFMQVSAPFAPFFTDHIYRNLRSGPMPFSVHLCDYPPAQPQRRDLELEQRMAAVRQAVTLGRSLRATHSLKNRQPLRCLHLVSRCADHRRILYEFQDIIAEELNVKDIVIREDESDLVHYEAKANFKALGKILGADMKAAAAKIASLASSEIAPLLDGRVLSVEFDGQQHQSIELTLATVEVRRSEKPGLKVINEDDLTLAFDVELDPELLQEGLMRDLIRQVQQERKQLNLLPNQPVQITISGGPELKTALADMGEMLTRETCSDWQWSTQQVGQAYVLGQNSTVWFKLLALPAVAPKERT